MVPLSHHHATIGVLCLLLPVSGCWTMANLEGKQRVFLSPSGQKPVRVYGGVRNYLEWISESLDHSPKKGERMPGRSLGSVADGAVAISLYAPIYGYLGVVDPVVSLAADTVTLPYVLHKRHSEESLSVVGVTPPK